jgi:hypothetical protein
MGEAVGIHQLLVGRPLLLELFEGAFVDDRAARLKLMDQDIHHSCAYSLVGVGPSALWLARYTEFP